MTEAEWLACAEPKPLLIMLTGMATDRKLRLLTAASCRRVLDQMPIETQSFVTLTERVADALVSETEYRTAWNDADSRWRLISNDPPNAFHYATKSVVISIPPHVYSVSYALSTTAIAVGMSVAKNASDKMYDSIVESESGRIKVEQAQLIREIFGNPFRPIILEPSWLTSTVHSLAQGIYEEKTFDRMPTLANALQDAGCDNEDILNHCRQPGEHCRGCWLVDLLLGKK
jgi:hypothetical protein